MKKLVITLCLLVFTSGQAFATCDYSTMCAPKAYDLSSNVGQVTSKVTGMTFIAEKIAQAIIRSELKKETKAKFKVEMKSYSVKDLLQGKFKSLRIYGKNLNVEDVYLSSFEVKTACDFNYVDISKNPIKFKENMVMNYALEITNADLQKTIKSAGYLDELNKTNLSAFGITFFKLSGADVQIKNGKLYFTINVTSPLSSKPVPIALRSDVKVEDGDIVLTKIDLVNFYTVIDLSKLTYLLNVINPLTFSTEILDNKNSKMSVKSVDMIGDKITIKGVVFIPKNK